jgi:cell fate (sporulation/competence/biofilm development) regulator YlbF (YheA/YmcA/DUF963 family)
MPKIETNAPVTDDDANEIEDGASEVEGEEIDDEGAEVEGSDGGAEVEEGAEGEGAEAAEGEEASEISITIGEPDAAEEDEEGAKPWVKELRRNQREMARALRDKDAEIARLKGATSTTVEPLGEEPTFEGCNYDPDTFRTKVLEWTTRKAAIEQQQRDGEQAAQAERAKWQTRLGAVQAEASKLKVPDYAEASDTLESTFSPLQMGIVLGGPNDPKVSAQLRYALGKNPKKARELAAITDPVKFAFAIAHVEVQLKVTPRKTAPTPERMARSSTAGNSPVDNTLAKLQAAADKSGDRSKVVAYMRQQKAKQAA